MSDAHPVFELRQYKIVKGERDRFMRLFDEAFVDSQEAVGMRLYGQFADLDDPGRFVWIRGFDDMAARERALRTFYSGPVWQARRDEANPLLDDNDNVLLLRPTPGGAVPARIDVAREAGRAGRAGMGGGAVRQRRLRRPLGLLHRLPHGHGLSAHPRRGRPPRAYCPG